MSMKCRPLTRPTRTSFTSPLSITSQALSTSMGMPVSRAKRFTVPSGMTPRGTREPHAYFMRKERAAGRLPASYAELVDRLHAMTGRRDGAAALSHEWEQLAHRYQIEFGPRRERAAQRVMARRLLALAQALQIVPTLLMEGPPADLRLLFDWMDAFPESDHGPVWLKAFEASYQDHLFGMLLRAPAKPQPAIPDRQPPVRPHSQSVFCIDVRSEPFRRHLESTGANDTYGFAGFFAVFIRYRACGKEYETEQFPVIMRAKNEVRVRKSTRLNSSH